MWNVQPTQGFTCSMTAVDLCWNPLWPEPFGRLRLHRQVLRIPFWLNGFARDFSANLKTDRSTSVWSDCRPPCPTTKMWQSSFELMHSVSHWNWMKRMKWEMDGNGWKWMNDKMLESRWIQRKAFTTLEIIIVQFHWSRPTLVRAPSTSWESFAVAWLDGRVFYYESIQVSRIRRLSSVSTPWTKCATRSSWRMLARIRQSIFICCAYFGCDTAAVGKQVHGSPHLLLMLLDMGTLACTPAWW